MKKRIDMIVSQKLNISRSKAQALIEDGCVFVDDIQILKVSMTFEEDCLLNVVKKNDYVSRGAYKLLSAIKNFNINFKDLIVLDMGASTGGFSQVALENGAKKVYSVDIGKDELDKTLACYSQIVNLSGRDIRSLSKDEVGDSNIVIGDLSFISLKHILPKIKELFGNIECVLLFKPQFECGKVVAKKFRGVIKDKTVHIKLLKDFIEELKIYDFELSNLTYSSIKGKSGNIEYLLHLNSKIKKEFDVVNVVDMAFSNL